MAGGASERRLQVAVWLTAAVAVLSIATGVTNIVATVTLRRVAVYVPDWLERGAGFTGTLTGFLLLVGAFGLRRRLRSAWVAVVLLLPVAVVQGLVQSSPLSLPLVVLALVAWPGVALQRRRFTRLLTPSTAQAAALVAVVGVLVYGTVGAFALRRQFAGVDSPLDALYFTMVTASTVGYGDATATSQGARLFVVSLVVLGPATFGIAAGTVLAPLLDARILGALGRMTSSELELLEDHVVVLGYGDLTEPILTELDGLDAPFVVVTPDVETVDRLSDRGYRALAADPSDEATLERVGLDVARAVVAATNDDAEDALSVLTARQLNHDVRIVAAATERENVQKLRRAGADTVISPAVLGGRLLVQSALGREDVESIANRLFGGEERGTGADADRPRAAGDGDDEEGRLD